MKPAPWLLLLSAALYVPYADAAVSGAVRGHVEDDGGLPVPGATVVLSGPGIAGELTTVTDADGNFRILNVPPGSHSVKVVKSGLAQVRLTVTVRLDETAFVPIVLEVAGAEEVVIEETLPVIDATRSSISTELSYESISNLPVGRSYQDAVNMLPGVSGRIDTQNGGPGNGNPSVRGEGQYGNNYALDGISTRDPATKTFGTNVNFDAIEDIQVYTDGAPAEFGQVTGMFVNVVTKDGGDEHHGSAAYYFSSHASGGTYPIADLATHEEVETTKRKFMNHEVSLTAGGPVLKERIWYFGAVDFTTGWTQFEGSTEEARQEVTGVDGFAKLSFFATDDITMRYQFNGGFSNIPNYESSSQYTAEAQARYHSDDVSHLFNIDWRPGPNSVWELRTLYNVSNINVEPMSGDEEAPSFYNLDSGQYYGNYDSFDLNQRGRLGGNLKLTQFVNDFAGSHRFKIGGEFWRLTDSRQLIFTGPGDGVQYTSSASSGLPCETSDQATGLLADCYGYTTYEDVGALGHVGNIVSGFIQDDWQPHPNVTLNLGFRADRETLLQNAGEVIVDNHMMSPRVGLAWDITGDSKTLLNAVGGRYYDLSGNTFADWGDTRSAFVYREYTHNKVLTGDPSATGYTNTWTQDPATDPLIYCNEQSLDSFGPDQWVTAQIACQGELRPYYLDKVAVGIKREIFPLFAVGLRGIASETRDLAEDVDWDLDTWVITNPEQKVRRYRALELTAEKKFDKRWQLLASYTLSESKGHMPGQFEIASGGQTGSDGNQVGVYLDDVSDTDTRTMYFDAGYGWLLDGLAGLGTISDDAGYYGYLPYHHFHDLKINGSYSIDYATGMGDMATTLGVVYEFSSGNAWQKRGFVWLYGDYFAFPEGRGSRFMPAVNWFDFRVAQKLTTDSDRELELSIDVFNLLDLKAPLTYYENDDENFGLTLYRQDPRSIRIGLHGTY